MHGDRSSVPSACHQAREQGVLGRLAIKVEGLRIELTSKCFDLLLVNNVGSAGEALPDVEIIEIEPIVVTEFRHGQCLSSSIFRKLPPRPGPPARERHGCLEGTAGHGAV